MPSHESLRVNLTISYTVRLTYWVRYKTGSLNGMRFKQSIRMVDAQHCAWFIENLLKQRRKDRTFGHAFLITPL